ncbi:hypothetical protein L6452_11804 [Arctium lappa]|uniref:Uncharacterized protein n=1 Tax=Arctium lappa TaxID=4217 RepID=A0ACB9DPX1_ARCLA|nr:hypothetical protein L6452_11804 [Arctium lappa]
MSSCRSSYLLINTRSENVRNCKAAVCNKESYGKKGKFEDNILFGKDQSKISCVNNLDEDGFPYVGANLHSGDIVIGKYAEFGGDHSVKLKHGERGSVQKVVLSANDDGKNFGTASLRQVNYLRLLQSRGLPWVAH